MISRVAGLIRDIFTTNLLGASIFHDIFVVVLKIPNVFRKFLPKVHLAKLLFQYILST